MIRSLPVWEPTGGTLLIVGSAPCVHDDLREAEALGQSHKLLINGAGLIFEHAEHWLIGHGEKVGMFKAARAKVFATPIPYIHGSRRGGTDPVGVTHIWEGVSTGGTSAWKAVRIGKGMGYDRIILCGCPLDDSGYVSGESDGIRHDCKRIGHGQSRGVNRMYDNYRRTFAVRAEQEGHGVYSMSGYSRELLGAPC